MMTAPFSKTPFTAPDAVFALKAAFDADDSPQKINLGPGAYLDDHGKPWRLSSVAEAELELHNDPPGHEYLPILGLPSFRTAAQHVVFGSNSRLLAERRVATVQSVSGTGAIHLAFSFLKQIHPSNLIYISDPSWSNHRIMAEFLNFDVVNYPYYNATKKEVAFEAMRNAMELAEEGSIWVLHACAHNPTGCDLSEGQWRELGGIIRSRRLLPILDCAYQGYATGDLERDAWSIRYLLDEMNIPGIVCQSFSKSMGLYGERVGAIHIVEHDDTDAERLVRNIESQLGWISRKEISVPPRYGATIAARIIGNPRLYNLWQEDLRLMSSRIATMRQAVVDGLRERATPGSWQHIVEQIGMFSFTGLTQEHVQKLREKHIYLLGNGRISISGLNTRNVDYFCQCVDEAVRP